jgi:hypothetical protein
MSDMGCSIPVMNDKAKKEVVCVWKSNGDYYNTCWDYAIPKKDYEIMEYIFCPYCGKKIEVIE